MQCQLRAMNIGHNITGGLMTLFSHSKLQWVTRFHQCWKLACLMNTTTFIFPFYENIFWTRTMVCTPFTTSHTLLSRTQDYEHERGQDSAYVTVRSHGKPASTGDFPWRFTEAGVISKVQLVDKREGHNPWTTADEQTKGDNSIAAVNRRMLWPAGSLAGGKGVNLWGLRQNLNQCLLSKETKRQSYILCHVTVSGIL